ncbi:HdeD family acid-resistance protein [Lapidilactobacillus luobeiensis]|uniref:HdeD family acid-resistance protein n=1 Tax=Lapidilactobacillus luobeiensis TaxID=2950371 RepID=UPI0021C36521|nr:DUF308 domain-containing protein [Lapidilactobacillus luobeiensis]
MDKLVKNIKRNMWLRAAIFIILGLVLAFYPKPSLNGLVKLMALYLAIMGVIDLIGGNKERAQGGSLNGTMIGGIIKLVGAIFVYFFAKSLLNAIPFILGIVLLVHGINYVMQLRGHRQFVNVSPLPGYIYGILLIVAAVVMILNPFGAVTVLVQVFGWILVVMGIFEIFGTRFFK